MPNRWCTHALRFPTRRGRSRTKSESWSAIAGTANVIATTTTVMKLTRRIPAPAARLKPRFTMRSSTGLSRYAMPSAARIGPRTPAR